MILSKFHARCGGIGSVKEKDGIGFYYNGLYPVVSGEGKKMSRGPRCQFFGIRHFLISP